MLKQMQLLSPRWETTEGMAMGWFNGRSKSQDAHDRAIRKAEPWQKQENRKIKKARKERKGRPKTGF
jgi:hypothetical protein